MDSLLPQKIEAILFYLAEPTTYKDLAKILNVSASDVQHSISLLHESLADRGIRLVEHNNTVALVTAPALSETVDMVIREERERDLGRAGLETLSIVAYKGPVSRKEIDYIRGVNSQFALRNLLLRGLIDKKTHERDERVMVYTITTDALMHLGLERIEDLPEYQSITEQLLVDNTPTETDGE